MQRGMFVGKVGRGIPWLSNIFYFPKKYLYTILLSFEMKLRKLFHTNFVKRVVILLNCPKGRKVTKRPPVGGIIAW